MWPQPPSSLLRLQVCGPWPHRAWPPRWARDGPCAAGEDSVSALPSAWPCFRVPRLTLRCFCVASAPSPLRLFLWRFTCCRRAHSLSSLKERVSAPGAVSAQLPLPATPASSAQWLLRLRCFQMARSHLPSCFSVLVSFLVV